MEAMKRKQEGQGGNVTPIKPQEGQPAPVKLSPEAQVNQYITGHEAGIKDLAIAIADLEKKLDEYKTLKVRKEAFVEAFKAAQAAYTQTATPVKKERKPRAPKSHKALGSTVEPVVPPAQ